MSKIYIEDKTFKSVVFSVEGLLAGEYNNCTFINCDFSNTNLSEINFEECQFEDSEPVHNLFISIAIKASTTN